MPKKKQVISGSRDWDSYIDGLFQNQNIQAVVEEMESMTGSDLYSMESYSNMASYLIDRPVINAMHGTQTNYPIKSVDSMTDLLVNGAIYYYVSDVNHIRKEDFVKEALYDPISDQLYSILVGYFSEDDLWFFERYVKGGVTDTGDYVVEACTHTVYMQTDNSDPDFGKLEVKLMEYLPFFPWISARWKSGVSFLDKVRASLIRLECAYRVIATENIERRGSAIFIEGVKDTDKIKKAPRSMGRSVYTTPPNSKFSSPGSDAPGLALLSTEIESLENGIERATGVVSVKQLANLSGVARIIAERPLIFLCEEIRNLYSQLLTDIHDLIIFQNPPEPLVTYRPLWEMDPVDRLALLDNAKANNAISDKEYSQELRALLNLS